MAHAIVMPKLGQTVEEAAIVKWHKNEGDAVKKGDVLFEIETDKAVLEAESFHDGTLLKVLVNEGDTVPVSSTVAFIGKPGEELPDVVPPPSPAPAPVEPKEPSPAAAPSPSSSAPASASAPAAAATPPAVIPPAAPAVPARLFISPRARVLARESAIDPSRIRGTGPNGRIVVKDVRAYLDQNQYDQLRITPAAKRIAVREGVDILTVRRKDDSLRLTVADINRTLAEEAQPMTKMRQVIARRLTESFTTTPHFYVTVSIDMTDLLDFRKDLKARGESFTVTDFILESVILSLQECPTLNSVTDGNTVKWHGNVDLGMAVGMEDGLVVPVLRNADDMTMRELHDAAQELAAKARDRKLLPDEMTGSTFTVSNMGMLGVENFTAIINPGECAILAVASTIPTVVAIDGKVQIRAMMQITLSSDHRIVDGVTAAAFINAIKNKLEDITLWRSLI